MSWTGRLLVLVLLLLAGAAAAIWIVANSRAAARLLGVTPSATAVQQPTQPEPAAAQQQPGPTPQVAPATDAALEAQIADLQTQLQRLESQSAAEQGSADRSDALLVAFAARRAIDHGEALGYLEALLVQGFEAAHPQAVAAIVTASRTPVRLSDLISQYEDLKPALLGPPPNESWWQRFTRGLGSLVTIRHTGRESVQPSGRYQRALTALMVGEVDTALAETMRLPGAARAGDWIAKARQFIAAHRALDEIETAALIGKSGQG